jgi:ATP-dependent Clp protease, protease subunit
MVTPTPIPPMTRSDNMTGWYAIRDKGTGAEVAIYDEIGAHGVSAKGFLAELGALAKGTPIDVRLNSPGGSVFDAVAIHNALVRHEGTVTVWIDGIAASAASYIAMAGDAVVMPENAFLMIPDPAGLVMGTAEDMRAMAEALDKVKGSLVQGYAAKSGRPAEEIAALMAAETWFDARDALEIGFADRLAEPVRIAARFDIHRFRNAPREVVEGEAEPSPQWGGVSPPNETETETTSEPDNSSDTDTGIDAPDEEDDAPDSSVAPDNSAEAAETSDAATDSTENEPAQVEMPPPSGGPPDPTVTRAAVLTHARAILDLCRLAGQPGMAGRFLEQDMSLEEVRAALLAAKAEAEPEITAHHSQPGRLSATRPWGEIVARTFRLKG